MRGVFELGLRNDYLPALTTESSAEAHDSAGRVITVPDRLPTREEISKEKDIDAEVAAVFRPAII